MGIFECLRYLSRVTYIFFVLIFTTKLRDYILGIYGCALLVVQYLLDLFKSFLLEYILWLNQGVPLSRA